ncbi:MAG: GntR family transcriptional regulator [Lachnospiraceae bacterium]|nr:GntR family transcriptional regulator [Lachnospiraceae bacterium]
MTSDFQIDMDEYLPLREVVFTTLRRAILQGELKPGERLMEIALANRLGVSRTPIREAMRKLELEGLVVMIPRKGAQVAQITEQELNDVLEVRKGLEELAIAKACERIDEDELKELDQAARNFEKVIQTKDLTKLAEMDVQFHDIIYNATRNRRLVQILNNLREQMYRFRVEYLKDMDARKALVAEHDKIVAALRNKDAEAAKELIYKHIDNQQQAIITGLRNSRV